MRTTAPLLAFALAACADDPGRSGVAVMWTHEAGAAVAPAGVGAEGRVLVALSAATPEGGRLVTLQDFDGQRFEGPFEGVPVSDHAPVMAEGRIFVLTKIGGLVGLSLAGDVLFMNGPVGAPSATSPLTVGPGGVWWGTAAGFVASVGFDGAERFRASVQDPVTTPVAVAADGTSYAATDTGRVLAHDASGALVFDTRVDAPASGPAIGSGDIAVLVGEASGLRALGADGTDRWRRERSARVVGVSVIDGLALAWGEDGKLEGLQISDGAARFGFVPSGASPPPLYAGPVAVDGAFGLVDSAGTARLIDATGAEQASLPLGITPGREIVGQSRALFVSVGSTVHAVRFVYAKPSE